MARLCIGLLLVGLALGCPPVVVARFSFFSEKKIALRSSNTGYSFVAEKSARYDSMPFTRVGSLIIVRASVDSLEGNFILDTGAPGLILNATYFRHLPAHGTAHAQDKGGITGAALFEEKTLAGSLRLGSFHFFNLMADKVQLSHLENAKGIPIMGLLGYQLFRRFELLIDFEAEMIYLYRAPVAGPVEGIAALRQPGVWHTAALRITGSKVLAQVLWGRKKLNFVLDTGAESNVLDNRLPRQLMEQVTITRRVALVGSGQQKVEAWYGRVPALQIGNCLVQQPEVLLTSLSQLSEAYGYSIDGMLGNALLAQQRLGISFIHHTLYLYKQQP